MASANFVFSPFIVATTALAAGTSTGRAAINLPAGTPRGQVSMRVHNAHTSVVFIKFGDSTVTAAITDMPVPAGGVEIFDAGAADYIAGITGTGSGTVYVTPGVGA